MPLIAIVIQTKRSLLRFTETHRTAAKQANVPPASHLIRRTAPIPGDPRQLEATPAFIDAINADPKVQPRAACRRHPLGQQLCTLAYDHSIFDLWTASKIRSSTRPATTNGRTATSRAKAGMSSTANGNYVDYANGDPVANLALVRRCSSRARRDARRRRKMHVLRRRRPSTQRIRPTRSTSRTSCGSSRGVLFVTLNIPGGSNNDDDTWYGAATDR